MIRGSDTLARLGGDEFALVQLARAGRATRPTLAAKLLAVSGRRRSTSAARRCTPAASVGAAALPRGRGTTRTSWSRRADLALYRAKGEGRGRFRFFEPAMDEEVRAVGAAVAGSCGGRWSGG